MNSLFVIVACIVTLSHAALTKDERLKRQWSFLGTGAPVVQTSLVPTATALRVPVHVAPAPIVRVAPVVTHHVVAAPAVDPTPVVAAPTWGTGNLFYGNNHIGDHQFGRSFTGDSFIGNNFVGNHHFPDYYYGPHWIGSHQFVSHYPATTSFYYSNWFKH